MRITNEKKVMQSESNKPFNFDDLPIELLMETFFYLSPEDISSIKRVNQLFYKMARRNLLWREKYEQHFPHRKLQKEKQDTINYYLEFCTAYKKEYYYVPKEKRKLFSLVKEGDIANLKATLKWNDLYLVDHNGMSLLEWAQKNKTNRQRLLNYFYEIALNNYKDNRKPPANDTKKIDSKHRRTILHWAIACHQPACPIISLISQDASIKTLDALNRNALHFAAEQGQAEIVELLLTRYSANVNAHDASGATALMFATENGYKNVVDVLLTHQAHLSPCVYRNTYYHRNFKVVAGDTPLHAAIKSGRKDIVEVLMNHDANVITTQHVSADNALTLAAEQGQAEIAELLITHYHADVNARSIFCETALILAVRNGLKNVVDVLLTHLANCSLASQLEEGIYYPDTFNLKVGDTPLHTAIKLGRIDIIKTLIKHGADIHHLTSSGHNALTLTAEQGQAEIVELLITHYHADVNTQDRDGATALMLAIEKNHENVVDVLLKNGADYSIALRSNTSYHKHFNVVAGDTPLHAAIKLGRIDIVTVLIINRDTKAPTQNNVSGHNALALAARQGQAEIAELLITHYHANVNARDASGATAVMFATENGYKNVVDVLLKNGADCSIALQRNTSYHKHFNVVAGDTPLHVASRLNNVAIVRKLINSNANIETVNSQKQTPLDVAVKNAKNELKLLDYLTKTNRRENNHYKTSFSIFGHTFVFGYSAKQKKDAASALKEVVFKGAHKSCLDTHKGALNNGELKTIYRSLRYRYII